MLREQVNKNDVVMKKCLAHYVVGYLPHGDKDIAHIYPRSPAQLMRPSYSPCFVYCRQGPAKDVARNQYADICSHMRLITVPEDEANRSLSTGPSDLMQSDPALLSPMPCGLSGLCRQPARHKLVNACSVYCMLVQAVAYVAAGCALELRKQSHALLQPEQQCDHCEDSLSQQSILADAHNADQAPTDKHEPIILSCLES